MKKLLIFPMLFAYFVSYAQTVTIGTQVWTNKNLNVATYRNGDVIPQVQDQKAWANLTTGAWCYYNNDPAYGDTYGKLYNWYAVNDPRGLAPQGWHIPTDAEWTILATTLSNPVQDLMPYKYFFPGLPGGNRNYNGEFNDVGYEGYWWSATQYYSTFAWSRYLNDNNGTLNKDDNDKRYGFSVRCLRD